MNKSRLLMLADFLEGQGKFEGRAVKKDKFHLDDFNATYSKFSRKFKYKTDFDKPIFTELKSKSKIVQKLKAKNRIPVVPVECQTAGCAVGWACTIPEFNKLGFYLTVDYLNSTQSSLSYIDKDGELHTGCLAAEEFFDIGVAQFDYLFCTNSYKSTEASSPKAVAKRIRKFVKNNGE